MFRDNSECFGILWTTCKHGKVDHITFSVRIQSWSYTQVSKYPSLIASLDWGGASYVLSSHLSCHSSQIFLSPQRGHSSFLYIYLVFFIHWVIAHFSVFSSVQSLSRVQLFAIPWSAACQASLSMTNSWNSLRLMSIELVMPSSHLILCCPLLLLPQSLPASESFPMSQLFTKVLEFQL